MNECSCIWKHKPSAGTAEIMCQLGFVWVFPKPSVVKTDFPKLLASLVFTASLKPEKEESCIR